jgi:hypothetical protein
MKKNKNKAVEADGERSADVEIAPQALASLADRLKTELAKPKGDKGNDKRKKQRETKRQETSSANGTGAAQSKPALNKETQRNGIEKGSASDRSKLPSTEDKKGKPQKQAKSADTSKQPNSTSKDMGSRSAKSTPKSKSKGTKDGLDSSLLDEILALGGSKEDLELVEDVDTDEDILVGEDKPPTSRKKGGNDKTVYSLFSSCLP